jgi:hypothetical protein
MKIGDYIRAVSNDGFTVISGKIEEFTDIGELTVLQPNGTYRWIYPEHFQIDVKKKRSRLEVELLEKIEEFRSMGCSDDYIVQQFEKALEVLM